MVATQLTPSSGSLDHRPLLYGFGMFWGWRCLIDRTTRTGERVRCEPSSCSVFLFNQWRGLSGKPKAFTKQKTSWVWLTGVLCVFPQKKTPRVPFSQGLEAEEAEESLGEECRDLFVVVPSGRFLCCLPLKCSWTTKTIREQS